MDRSRLTTLTASNNASVLRLKFLTPLVAAIVLLVLTAAISLFYFESDSKSHGLLQERMTRTQRAAQEFYSHNVIYDANALHAIMDTLKYDDRLTEIFASYDRTALFKYTKKLFESLNSDYNVTHFYFIKPDRVNLLRVHTPGRYGDRIDRVTTLRAEESGDITYGVELGILGTLTLRVVSPWHDSQTGKLIGYIELGMEIDHIVSRISEVFGLDAFVMINKNVLNHEAWEAGMKALGRETLWDQFKNVVQSAEIPREIPEVLKEWIKSDENEYKNQVIPFEYKGASYRFLSIPVKDVIGRDVAQIILLNDVSVETGAARRTSMVVGAAVLGIGGLLIALFSWQAGRIGRRIGDDAKMLYQIATRDVLTGLYTRRAFDDFLSTEISRSSRYSHSASLLLIDIDHFKSINDDYGHQVGDMVLHEIGKRLQNVARNENYICRYGGEEIVIILPEADQNSAEYCANRLKKEIGGRAFDIVNNQSITVTVSIGIATYPAHADTGASLVAAADKALYKAKASGRNCICTYVLE